jgi:hypothetical protein
MNTYMQADGVRGRRNALVMATAAALAGALLVSGCGKKVKAPPAEAEAYNKALAYSKCLRDNGHTNWPDPDTKGKFPASADRTSAAYKKAAAACKSLEVAG